MLNIAQSFAIFTDLGLFEHIASSWLMRQFSNIMECKVRTWQFNVSSMTVLYTAELS